QIDNAVGFIRPCDGDGFPQIVIFRIAVRDHDVYAVDGSALKYRDQNFVRCGTVARLCRGELVQEPRCRRHQTKARQADAACPKKKSSVHIASPFAKFRASFCRVYLDAKLRTTDTFYFRSGVYLMII